MKTSFNLSCIFILVSVGYCVQRSLTREYRSIQITKAQSTLKVILKQNTNEEIPSWCCFFQGRGWRNLVQLGCHRLPRGSVSRATRRSWVEIPSKLTNFSLPRVIPYFPSRNNARKEIFQHFKLPQSKFSTFQLLISVLREHYIRNRTPRIYEAAWPSSVIPPQAGDFPVVPSSTPQSRHVNSQLVSRATCHVGFLTMFFI